jgi:hypothetical protein
MIRVQETTRLLPYYQPRRLTRLPLLYQRDHLFPYASYDDTADASAPRAFRMITVENQFLRIEVAPELGGRVYCLYDKRIGQEIIFRNPVVKPVRILPIWAFISGGIEFNFPIAHSPTSITEVGCTSGCQDHYGFVRVGEREARTGMEWVVELGLVADQPLLIQRSALRNLTSRAHPWMMWTIAAVRSTAETEFIHPPHRVLVHNDQVTEQDWPGNGLNWDRNARQMTALFWKPGSAPQFGAFHHDLGFGLMHLADPSALPGKKVWTYGHGPHRDWGRATTEGGLSYAEIESGPLIDQSEKSRFQSQSEQRYEEFWVPVHSRGVCDHLAWPKLNLPPMTNPWLGWKHSAWQSEWEEFRAGAAELPSSPVPTGLELEPALTHELTRGNRNAPEPLALWFAARGNPLAALPLVENLAAPDAQRIAGLICWKGLQDGARAVRHLEAGPLDDPVAVAELDELYAELNLTEKRSTLLARAPGHRLIIERRADLALITGQPEVARELLTSTLWPREHQRYVRTNLWRRIQTAIGEAESGIPESLHEDMLAPFGAYWSEQPESYR